MHASRSVEASQRKLATQRVKECRYLVELYELQARNADQRLSEADLDIGRVISAVRHSGTFPLPSPATALKRYGDKGTVISQTLVHLLIVYQGFDVAIGPPPFLSILTDYGYQYVRYVAAYMYLLSSLYMSTNIIFYAFGILPGALQIAVSTIQLQITFIGQFA